VPFLSKDKWAPYRFEDQSGRAGVVTQISFLSLFSHPAVSSPTKRGVALNEIFLCQPTPPPPNNVDFSAVNEGPNRAKTVRLRLEAHVTNPTCAGCHSLVDPTGVALERFDTLGQYREYAEGQLIDVHSQIGGKPFDGAVGLGKVLHDDPRVGRCLAKNLYATGVGRPASDRRKVDALSASFAAGGYRVPAFLKALAVDEDLYAAPVPVSRPAQVASMTNANPTAPREDR
jgi:hypothetical protein